MARYEHVPIYKKATDLAVYLEKIVRNFSRYHKDTVVAEPQALHSETALTCQIAVSREGPLRVEAV